MSIAGSVHKMGIDNNFLACKTVKCFVLLAAMSVTASAGGQNYYNSHSHMYVHSYCVNRNFNCV